MKYFLRQLWVFPLMVVFFVVLGMAVIIEKLTGADMRDWFNG